MATLRNGGNTMSLRIRHVLHPNVAEELRLFLVRWIQGIGVKAWFHLKVL